jgi:tRNA A37 threonylcarbamoyltransferase TsaD
VSTRTSLIRLAERRSLLQERASAERESLAAVMARSDEAALLLQRLRRLIEELRNRPWIVAGGVALLVALRPKRALGWLLKGWSAWRMYRGAQRWWKQIAGRTPDAA